MAREHSARDAPAKDELWFGHPRGLLILFFAEMWERFSFYGMRGLLVFYLTKHFLFDDTTATGIYASYGAMVYLTPVIGGLIADINLEDSTDPMSSGRTSNTEALLQTEWSYFKLYTPKSDLNIRFQYYPGISDSDRYRGDLRIRYRQEFVKDLFWNLTYYNSYDSKPPSGALSKGDVGVVSSIEYLF